MKKIERVGGYFTPVLCALVVSLSASAGSTGRPTPVSTAAVARISDVINIDQLADGRLLAVGRLDRISKSQFFASVLGQEFILLARSANFRFVANAQVGQPVALFGELVGNQYLVDAAIVLPGAYVEGASRVFMRGRVTSVRRDVGALSVGRLELDVSSSSDAMRDDIVDSGSLISLIGSQPAISGLVLVEHLTLEIGREYGRSDASVGTGRTDASVGTGRPDASVGTGRPSK